MLSRCKFLLLLIVNAQKFDVIAALADSRSKIDMPPKRKLETVPDVAESLPDAVISAMTSKHVGSRSKIDMAPKRKLELIVLHDGVPLPDAVVSAMTPKPVSERSFLEQLAVRYRILVEFEEGNGPTQAAKNVNDIFGAKTITQASCSRWFKKFREGDTRLVKSNIRCETQADCERIAQKTEREAEELHDQVMLAYAAKKKK
ncbi:histone-lysine N-methyltransferase SETMAR-like [Ditylenchus destructor]|nr:histone-lysine N-methyltransferase SETMAR-like [Ditylenchus destructor]